MADTDHDRRMQESQEKIERLQREAETERRTTAERVGIDREVEQEMQTVRPGSAAPARAGITPSGSGADGERG